MQEIKNWIIGIGGSEVDNVIFYTFVGTESQVKQKLMEFIREDKLNDAENYDHGTEKTTEIEKHNDGSLYGYNCFSSYHTDYAARPFDQIKDVA